MQTIGVRELKAKASQVIRDVRQHKARYMITHRGKVVAQITPAEDGEARQQSAQEWLASLDELIEAVARTNPGPVDAVELVREGRR